MYIGVLQVPVKMNTSMELRCLFSQPEITRRYSLPVPFENYFFCISFVLWDGHDFSQIEVKAVNLKSSIKRLLDS